MPTDVKDWLGVLQRRMWWIIVPTIVGALVMVVVARYVPKSFRSETLILVEPQKVPETYVTSTVSGAVTDRLQTLSSEILSRTRLDKIMNQFNLYAPERQRRSHEEVIELMRADISVRIETSPRHNQRDVGAFRISYIGPTPETAQQVTREIASLFIAENLRAREQQAEGTSEFIERELEKARGSLQEQEQKIRGFKAQHIGALPEQQQANLSMLAQYQTLLQTNSDALGRAQQQKTYLESLKEALTHTPGANTTPAMNTELEAKRSAVSQLRERYKPTHPDLLRAELELAAMEKRAQLAPAQSTPVAGVAAGTQGSPQSIDAQLQQVKEEVVARSRRQTELEQRIRGLQNRIEILPTVEQQFAEINRDYTTSQENYQALLGKRNQSVMAAEMERHAKGEQFRILDPANFPEEPFKPKMILLYGGGAGGGLVFGLLLAFVMELRDWTIHDERDLGFYCSVPVLGTIPQLEITGAQPRRWFRGKSRTASAA